jgi:hypothetical protein
LLLLRNILSSHLLSKNVKIRIYKTVILPVLLHGYETWSLTLMEDHRLRVFENRMLRKIFGHKREEVAPGLRKLLHYLCYLPYIINVLKLNETRCGTHGMDDKMLTKF